MSSQEISSLGELEPSVYPSNPTPWGAAVERPNVEGGFEVATAYSFEPNSAGSSAVQANTTATGVGSSQAPEPYKIMRGGGSIRACRRCRQVKAKCDGDGISACRRCSRLDLACEYPDRCAAKITRAPRGAKKRKATELPANLLTVSSSSSSSKHHSTPQNTEIEQVETSWSFLPEESALSLDVSRPIHTNGLAEDAQHQISWMDFLRRPELATHVRSEGWIEELRTWLMFSLRNDDTIQLGYVLVMAGSSGLTLRDLIRSPAEQAHAVQLMFGGTPTLQLENGAQYEPMVHDLNEATVDGVAGPLPSCLSWIWEARDCALFLECTTGDGNTNMFVNSLFLSTVQSKENLLKSIATNHMTSAYLSPSELEKMMSLFVKAFSEVQLQPSINFENGSTVKVLRFELEENGIMSLGRSFIEVAVTTAGATSTRYICVCVRPVGTAIESESIQGNFNESVFPRQGATEHTSDDDLIAAVLGDGEI